MGSSLSKKSRSKRGEETEQPENFKRRIKPIEKPKACTWGLRVRAEDVTKIRAGFYPRDMDEKWLCEADEPDIQGEVVVHFTRSWTLNEIFRFRLVPDARGEEGSATITKFEYAPNYPEEDEAKNMVVMICNNILECNLEA